MIFPFTGSTQIIKDIDEITPFHEGLAAVRKGKTWAFIDPTGKIVIDYRDDVVMSKVDNKSAGYPHFRDGRCLIKEEINGINYYGYIDKNGEKAIKPAYLNATSFYKGYAIVLKIAKEELGKNDLLGKKVVSYSYDEVVIDPSGNSKAFLAGPVHLIYKKDRLRNPPSIQSYLLSSNLAAMKDKDNRWQLFSLNSSE